MNGPNGLHRNRHRHQYDNLSEFAHPNWAGTTLLYSKSDPKNLWTDFGANIRGSASTKQVGAINLSVALMIFERNYNLVGDDADAFGEFRGHAQQFYKNVRCGILHQAETTGDWRVVRVGPLFDPRTFTVNATLFLETLQHVLDGFCNELKTSAWDSAEWKKVREKMDAICANCRR